MSCRSLKTYLKYYLSVCVFIVLVCSGVVILLYEAKVFFSLPLQHQLSALLVGRQVALSHTQESRERASEERPVMVTSTVSEEQSRPAI